MKGEGNSLNYTFRMHDPRVGRFFARDPLSAHYPYYSPYQFSGNRVIDMVELEGLEPANYDFNQDPLAPVRIIVTVAQDLEIASYNAVTYLHAYFNPFNNEFETRTVKEKVTREDGFTDVEKKTVRTGLKDLATGSLDVLGTAGTIYGGPSGLLARSQSSTSTSNIVKQAFIKTKDQKWATRSENYRKNLEIYSGIAPKAGDQAHHMLPKDKKFADFFEYNGIDVNNPAFMKWMQKDDHIGKFSEAYGKLWENFIKVNKDKVFSPEQLMKKAKEFEVKAKKITEAYKASKTTK